jgi:uncharacterized protein (DUF362 family)
MMDDGIKELTGIEDIGEAWKSIFPDITPDKKICIKVNCIAAGNLGLCSHSEVAYAIVNGLLSMQFGDNSFAEENITIFDRSNSELSAAGYSLNNTDVGVQCRGSMNRANSGSTVGHGTTGYSINGSIQYLSSIFEESDYIINLAVMKNHSFAGVTLSLKNHYGTIHMPGCEEMHGNHCDPAVAELNAIEPLQQKQVLCICDAIYAVITSGPGGRPQVVPNKLVLSKDSVALDAICTQILIDNGMAESKRSTAHYIDTAANDDFNLGVSDINNIDVVRLGIETSVENNLINNKNFKIYSNYPNPVQDETTFVYQLFNSSEVILDLYTIEGQLVKRLINERQAPGYYRKKYNFKSTPGIKISKGIYIAKFIINNESFSQKVQFILKN